MDAIAGDSSSWESASVTAQQEGAWVVLTIDPADGTRADATLTPDQAKALAVELKDAAGMAKAWAG